MVKSVNTWFWSSSWCWSFWAQQACLRPCCRCLVHGALSKNENAERGRETEKAIFIKHIQTSSSFPLTKSVLVSLVFQLFALQHQSLRGRYVRYFAKTTISCPRFPPDKTCLLASSQGQVAGALETPLVAEFLWPAWINQQPLCDPFWVPACRKSLNLFPCFVFAFLPGKPSASQFFNLLLNNWQASCKSRHSWFSWGTSLYKISSAHSTRDTDTAG